jgi:hypothetical protein
VPCGAPVQFSSGDLLPPEGLTEAGIGCPFSNAAAVRVNGAGAGSEVVVTVGVVVVTGIVLVIFVVVVELGVELAVVGVDAAVVVVVITGVVEVTVVVDDAAVVDEVEVEVEADDVPVIVPFPQPANRLTSAVVQTKNMTIDIFIFCGFLYPGVLPFILHQLSRHHQRGPAHLKYINDKTNHIYYVFCRSFLALRAAAALAFFASAAAL